jgi:hypothetical protein
MAARRGIYGQPADLVPEHVSLVHLTSQVLTTFNNAAKAAGIKQHAVLRRICCTTVEQAQVLTQLTSTRNPRVTRSVNVSELQFDDNEPNPYAYETNVHEFPHDLTRPSMTLWEIIRSTS